MNHLTILISLLALALSADAKPLKVFILAGQSNMEGHAKIETFDYIGDDPATAPRLNILLFTADDMNYDSSGVYGGPIKDLTPHIDALAAQGLRFEHRTRDSAYIGNAWSDGQREYHAEGMSGLFSQGRSLRQDRSRAGETLVTQTHAA